MATEPWGMTDIQVSRTLVKSPPELWTELEGDALQEAIGDVTVRTTEPERALAWEAKGVRGTAVIEPSGWGTKVTLTAEIAELEQVIAQSGFWSRWRQAPPPPPVEAPVDAGALGKKLEALLDDLGSAHRKKPFSGV
ncbi:MAG: hypothetical protein QOG62_106 [Thermoleophilaceae bacterium]|jgi:hypothetical protein|nr:hypothetical protein [Thermoleophilaceae bacterium]